MTCGGSPKSGGFTVSTPELLKRSLGQRLIPVIDRVRDLATQLGTRPYRVRLIRTRFSGPRRGVGVESVVYDLELLPTPKVVDMSSLTEVITPAGMNEQGTVQLQQISGRYTEEMLVGVGPDGNQVAANEAVYYEVEFFRRDGGPSEKRRFVRDVLPFYDAGKVEWVVTLVSAVDNRSRAGTPEG